jgi:hypothetical protein
MYSGLNPSQYVSKLERKKNKIRRTYVLHEPPVSTSHNKLEEHPQKQKQTISNSIS